MNLTTARPSLQSPLRIFPKVRVRTGFAYALIIILAMVAFELFNYGTTVFALNDLLGDITFAGIRWATFLAVAFCGIDFAGIASLISQPRQRDNKDAWYLFGAWLIAGTANAALTWWGVSMAIVGHSIGGSAVINATTLIKVVPIFVAVMVWVIRVLIISSLSTALERLTRDNRSVSSSVQRPVPQVRASYTANRPVAQPGMTRASASTGSVVTARRPETQPAVRPQVEQTYHPLSTSAYDANAQDRTVRRM